MCLTADFVATLQLSSHYIAVGWVKLYVCATQYTLAVPPCQDMRTANNACESHKGAYSAAGLAGVSAKTSSSASGISCRTRYKLERLSQLRYFKFLNELPRD